MGIFSIVDDKHIPLYRVVRIADVPHFYGAEDCTAEGRYEIRLDGNESVWANGDERDNMLDSINRWQDHMDDQED